MIYRDITQIPQSSFEAFQHNQKSGDMRLQGVCGFDGFIDHFIRMEQPDTMAEFGERLIAAAGVSASYTSSHLGEKFGGNGPLFATALHGIHGGDIDVHYIGALGKGRVLPIFEDALRAKMKSLHTLADPAHSDCLEFRDGKIMLGDLKSCTEICWDRMLECMGEETVDRLLTESDFIAAVNWGKLDRVGSIWGNMALRLKSLNVPENKVVFFMDLAEFEHRSLEDKMQLPPLLSTISRQCQTVLSLNLKEAWQLGDLFGGSYQGLKLPHEVMKLADFIRGQLEVDRVLIHPNDGAVCASSNGTSYVPGPFCQNPLISTGAGDHFGAGALAGVLSGLDDLGILLAGVISSGYYVRSGKAPTIDQSVSFLDLWEKGDLPERLIETSSDLSVAQH